MEGKALTNTPQESNSAANTNPAATKSNAITVPQISLPKGGGALKGIDEKFTVNPSNGTASCSISVPVSPGRNGFQPSLAVSYNSGSGNSLYGLGWNIDYPSIQRKTGLKLPRYDDLNESDDFMFSGIDDLVPVLKETTTGWVRDEETTGGFTILRYRPRIEGSFSRIERITRNGSTGFYWKTTTRDNTVTFFGKNDTHRIADPADPSKIFKWLPEISFDDKGNCMVYEYKEEDLQQVENTLHEKNRFNNLARFTNRYLKRIRYGNMQPFYPDYSTIQNIYDSASPGASGFLFETVFDYGEHSNNSTNETTTWLSRIDPFSDYRSGFEIRTYRLCRRILIFHHFTNAEFGLPGNSDERIDYLVRSLDFIYSSSSENSQQPAEVTYLTSVKQTGYKKDGAGYKSKSLPALEFSYQLLNWDKQIRTIDPENIMNAPAGLSGNYNWVDLFNEGVPGILTEQAAGWFYKNNLGNGTFTPAQLVSPRPSVSGLAQGVLQLQDLDADGNKQIVSSIPGLSGFYELTDDNEWNNFQSFENMPVINWRDSYARFLDLQGDGKADILITEENGFSWYPSAGKKGYENKETVPGFHDEENGPAIVFRDELQTIFLADMCGDGLTDIVRIRNGEICYWPNLGYGKFGAKVTMSNAPCFDQPGHFNPAGLYLTDISGTGATDIIYVGKNGFAAYLNLSGNAWSNACDIDPFFTTEKPNQLSFIDLLGNGTPCVVWSSPLPAHAANPMRFIDLMGGKKPHVLTGYKNNLGKEISYTYKSSSAYYLDDKKTGKPWITKLPFPVQCVSTVTTIDRVSNVRFSTQYKYHHGYFDHPEREFRGFGMVEQTDTEEYEALLDSGAANATDSQFHEPPALVKTWFHTGAYIRNKKILDHYTQEYWYNNPEVIVTFGDLSNAEYALPDSLIIGDLSPAQLREAHRACKGMVLRKETFALDGTEKELLPFSVETHNCHIKQLQPIADNHFSVFMVQESEAITFSYERDPADPRISHALNIEIDDLGNVLKKAAVVYSRKTRPAALIDDRIWNEQNKTHITINENRFTQDIKEVTVYRLRLPFETKQFEGNGFTASMAAGYYSIADFTVAAGEIGYEESFTAGLAQKRLIEQAKTIYLADDLVNPMPQGHHDSLGFGFESYQLAFTPGVIDDVYRKGTTTLVNTAMLSEGKYIDLDLNGNWWIRSGTMQFISQSETTADAAQRFYVVRSVKDPFGTASSLTYDNNYFLFLQQTKDALDNFISVEQYDFRTLQPVRMKDVNANITAASIDILGLVAGTAIMGKGDEADDLQGFEPDESEILINDFFLDPFSNAAQLLKHATSRLVYDYSRIPCSVATIIREEHFKNNNDPILQYSFEYSDGSGNVVLKKIQAQPGDAPHRDAAGNLVKNADGSLNLQFAAHRWISNGRTILNNKGKPVKQYEPYFMDSHLYETEPELRETGVTSIMHYDSAGRAVRTDMPDQTFTTIEYDSWQQINYDANDNVLESGWYTKRINPTSDDLAEFNAEGKDPAKEKVAAEKTAIHAHTPSIVHLDSLGRSFCTIAHNKRMDFSTNTIVEEFYTTLNVLDIEGNLRAAIDACNNEVMSFKYNMLGHLAYQSSMDAGERWVLNNCMGSPFFSRDNKAQQFKTDYDVLQRPLTITLATGTSTPVIIERRDYIDTKGLTAPDLLTQQQLNLLGKSTRQYDNAGISNLLKCDFKGNILESSRQLCRDYKNIPQWPVPHSNQMEEEVFATISEYDTLNRPVRNIVPHANPVQASTVTPHFNETGLLDTVSAQIQGHAATADFVTHIEYSAKVQRVSIQYANDTITRYTYDKNTFRLLRVLTTANSGTILKQDLRYVYDAVGNITHIQDHAQETVFFNGEEIVASGEYDYDATYQLIRSKGREHAGQNTILESNDTSYNHNFRNFPFANANDTQALRNYIQFYFYDAAGNIIKLQHVAKDAGFTRKYWYNNNDADRNELGVSPATIKNNQLLQTQVGTDVPDWYAHDIQGNILNLPQVISMNWNYKNQVKQVDLGGGGMAYYVYDAAGQRIRKVIEKNGGRKEERLYLGVAEVFRITTAAGVIKRTDTLHIMDNAARVAMIDTPVIPGEDGEEEVQRFVYSNHIGSSSLELNESGNTISYEEYHPFGTTSMSATNASIKATAKRYRYIGKERDEETGMAYHGARYYLPWLGRWLSADPKGMIEGGCLYRYSMNNPVTRFDASGTDSTDSDENKPDTRRTYQLGLGGNERGLAWYFKKDSEANTNLLMLATGGLDQLNSWQDHWWMKGAIVLLGHYITVVSHESGHWREGYLQMADPYWTLSAGFIPTITHTTGGTTQSLIDAGGVNQNTLNARSMFRDYQLSGGSRSFAEQFVYWENEVYLTQYAIRGKYHINLVSGANDMENYTGNSQSKLDDMFYATLTLTGLNILSQAVSGKLEKATNGIVRGTRFEALLTSSGRRLYGIQSFVKPAWCWPTLEVTLDATRNLGSFSFGVKAHDIPINDEKDITISPFFSVSNGGVSAGSDLTYYFDSKRLGFKLTGGYRDSSNPLNEIEGVPSGGYGTANLFVRFGGHK